MCNHRSVDAAARSVMEELKKLVAGEATDKPLGADVRAKDMSKIADSNCNVHVVHVWRPT